MSATINTFIQSAELFEFHLWIFSMNSSSEFLAEFILWIPLWIPRLNSFSCIPFWIHHLEYNSILWSPVWLPPLNSSSNSDWETSSEFVFWIPPLSPSIYLLCCTFKHIVLPCCKQTSQTRWSLKMKKEYYFQVGKIQNSRVLCNK